MSRELYQIKELKTEIIDHLRRRTITAILLILIAYIISCMLLVVMFITSQMIYCYFSLIIPLFVYLWIITFGGKNHINNYYGFKKTSDGIMLYRKQREIYSSYIWVLVLIYYISSIVRLFCEIRNLKIINTEIVSRSR